MSARGVQSLPSRSRRLLVDALDGNFEKAVVLSKNRDLTHRGETTPSGLQRLLQTQKICCQVIGATPEQGGVLGRGKQIAAWLAKNGAVESDVVIDDDDPGVLEQGHPLVKSNSGIGLSEEDLTLTTMLLNSERAWPISSRA